MVLGTEKEAKTEEQPTNVNPMVSTTVITTVSSTCRGLPSVLVVFIVPWCRLFDSEQSRQVRDDNSYYTRDLDDEFIFNIHKMQRYNIDTTQQYQSEKMLHI
ncbi:MAG: hypothetical protein MJZ46_06615 [Bacteroidales bacterium]|nr:hypothetical protein [Bacteroidales bacterium]